MVFRLPNYWSNWKLEMLVLRRGENRSTRKKTSLSKGENQQQTNPHNSWRRGREFESGLYWWATSALITAPPFHPM